MILFTDGTTKATTDEITAALVDSQDADKEETATELQAFIDADEKLTAAGVTAIADDKDSEWVAVQLPDDVDGQPKFWAGQAAIIGEDLGSNKARTRKDKMQVELTRISGLL